MNKFILGVIIFLAIILRFGLITSFPKCLNWDEVSFSYNAYSILETGKDEYGTRFPVQFKSVGDYKYPFYIYSLVPVIKIFGLNEFSARFLPALAGVLSVFFIYKISKIISKSEVTALSSAFLLTISPWNIQFTRAGSDVGYASLFVLFGVFGLLSSIKNKTNPIVSLIGFSFALFTYYGERVFVPLFLICGLVYFYPDIRKSWKLYLPSAIVFLFVSALLFMNVLSPGQQSKLAKTTIFGQSREDSYEQRLKEEDVSLFTFNLFHSEPLEKIYQISDHYLNHLSPSFLFLEGPSEDKRQFVYGMGLLYIFEFPLLMYGLYKILKNNNRYYRFLLLWLLISPIPAAITRDAVHARRAINMIAPLTIISGIGLGSLIIKLKDNFSVIKYQLTALISFVFILHNILYYFSSYLIFTPNRSYKGPGTWQCGYKELVQKVQQYKKAYNKIVIDTSYQGPYLYFLFYEQYPPEKYQPQAELILENEDSLGEGAGYDNYEFRPIYWPDDRFTKDVLFIGPPERLPEKDLQPYARLIDRVYFFTGEEAFIIASTKN